MENKSESKLENSRRVRYIARAIKKSGESKYVDCKGLDLSGLTSEEMVCVNENTSNLKDKVFDFSNANLEKACINDEGSISVELTIESLRGANCKGLFLLGMDLEGALVDRNILESDSIDFGYTNWVGQNLEGLTLSEEVNFYRANFSHSNVSEVNFNGAELGRAIFQSAVCKKGIFINCMLVGLKACQADFSGSNFTRATMMDCDFEGSDLSDCFFSETYFTNEHYKKTIVCFRGVNLANSKFFDVHIENIELSGSNCKDTLFLNVRLENAICQNACFIGAEFSPDGDLVSELIKVNFSGSNSNLSMASFLEARLEKVDFSGSKLREVIFNMANIKNVNFSSSKLMCSKFKKAEITHSTFYGANLLDATFEEARLYKTIFGGQILTGVNFTKVNFTKCNLAGAVLNGCNLTNANFTDCDLEGVVLIECKFAGINFVNFNLKGLHFIRCDLSGFDFTGCNLAGFNFTGCNLAGANFTNCNLAGAVFDGCNLAGADFTNADIANAVFISSDDLSGLFNGAINTDQANFMLLDAQLPNGGPELFPSRVRRSRDPGEDVDTRPNKKSR